MRALRWRTPRTAPPRSGQSRRSAATPSCAGAQTVPPGPIGRSKRGYIPKTGKSQRSTATPSGAPAGERAPSVQPQTYYKPLSAPL
eukprot:498501-Prorocentrum_minimum.AAC.2